MGALDLHLSIFTFSSSLSHYSFKSFVDVFVHFVSSVPLFIVHLFDVYSSGIICSVIALRPFQFAVLWLRG